MTTSACVGACITGDHPRHNTELLPTVSANDMCRPASFPTGVITLPLDNVLLARRERTGIPEEGSGESRERNCPPASTTPSLHHQHHHRSMMLLSVEATPSNGSNYSTVECAFTLRKLHHRQRHSPRIARLPSPITEAIPNNGIYGNDDDGVVFSSSDGWKTQNFPRSERLVGTGRKGWLARKAGWHVCIQDLVGARLDVDVAGYANEFATPQPPGTVPRRLC